MPRTVPGSGAAIFPVFNSIFGVREVYVTAGGSGYDPADPPRLRIENCGTPIRDAVLRPVIEGSTGEIDPIRAGKKALIELGKVLENEKELEIIVEGHTDADRLSSSTSPKNK